MKEDAQAHAHVPRGGPWTSQVSESLLVALGFDTDSRVTDSEVSTLALALALVLRPTRLTVYSSGPWTIDILESLELTKLMLQAHTDIIAVQCTSAER